MVRKWTEDGGGGEKSEKLARMVAEFQRGCYHISTFPVKEYLEVIGKKGDAAQGSGFQLVPHLPDRAGSSWSI